MIDHVSLGTTRYAASVAFYQRVLAPLGLTLVRDTGAEASFGTRERWGFFLYPAPEGEQVTGRGMHLAFAAPSRAAVRAVHEAALAAQGKDLFTPRERPDSQREQDVQNSQTTGIPALTISQERTHKHQRASDRT